MRTRIENVRVALPALLAVGVIAVAVAGCGGRGGGSYGAVGSGAARSIAAASHRPARAAPTARRSAGIPQHDGGDMDADNNGAASDGDGNQ